MPIWERSQKWTAGSKPEAVCSEALAIIGKWHADFGPTLAAEKLRELHGICLGRETVRIWMIEAGFWCERKKRRARVHQPRYRRDCIGELIQIDGSEHRWFEGREPMCTLLVYIDDATSRLTQTRGTVHLRNTPPAANTISRMTTSPRPVAPPFLHLTMTCITLLSLFARCCGKEPHETAVDRRWE